MTTYRFSEWPGLVWVAWHGGGSQTLRIGLRHLAKTEAVERQAAEPRVTLCGRSWKRSREVIPNRYWTNGDCSFCVRKAERS